MAVKDRTGERQKLRGAAGVEGLGHGPEVRSSEALQKGTRVMGTRR